MPRASSAPKRNPQSTNGKAADSPARILLVDDHPMWRATVRRILEGTDSGEVVAEAADGEEAVRIAAAERPDVVIMDLNLPGMDGNAATRGVLAACPTARVLVLSASDDRRHVLDAVHAGAQGYLLKTSEPNEVLDAFRRVRLGEFVLPPQVAEHVLQELRTPTQSWPSAAGIRVAVADGSALFREGLTRILAEAGVVVTAAYDDLDQLVALLDEDAPDVVVVESRFPGAHDAGVVQVLRRSHAQVGILVLAQQVDAETATAVLESGAAGAGYLLKDRVAAVDQLIESVLQVAAGLSVVDPEVAGQILQASGGSAHPLAQLTARERDVLALMAEGRSNQAISGRLFLSAKAVEGHVRNIFMKLGLEPAPDDHRRVLAVLTYCRSV